MEKRINIILTKEQIALLEQGYHSHEPTGEKYYAFVPNFFRHIKNNVYEMLTQEESKKMYNKDFNIGFTKADMEKAFIAGGKLARNLESNDDFDTFISKY